MEGISPHLIAAIRLHEMDNPVRSFGEDLLLHLEHGYVISTPGFFVMGRPVNDAAGYHDLVSPWVHHPSPNAWWVYLAAGPLPLIIRSMPFVLPRIGFERDGVPVFYGTRKFLSRSKHSATRTSRLV